MKKILLATVFLVTSIIARDDYFDEYAKVTHSKPIYENVEIVKQHRHNRDCYEEYTVRKPRVTRSNENSIGIDTIIGVASGIAIGNQIGKGNGRTAAKVVGGILGATVANSMRNYRHVDDYNDGYYTKREKRIVCNSHNRRYTKRVLKGYDNYFIYNGREYVKFSEHKKRRVRVTTTISF